ncbi:unnamed protein product [Acidocella sp. C78]|uniref:AraC family transcriptional regulator ligand-binding domain-containing protein n=1 Tax=Acidocella sp. C78 TaxID=1671486 RepID=UPI001BBE8D4D|nr:AraC family transcriptional regulator ligand-binding domain-containing protein [Acidocella sp. C78]CAG4929504.1 unnamed protein product [Acidocella sp. C78]
MGLPAAASGSTSCHVLAAAASGVTSFIRGAGADPDLVLGEAGFDPRDLEDPCATVPLARYVAMMERAAARSGDTHFGLRFGQHSSRGARADRPLALGGRMSAPAGGFRPPLHRAPAEYRNPPARRGDRCGWNTSSIRGSGRDGRMPS